MLFMKFSVLACEDSNTRKGEAVIFFNTEKQVKLTCWSLNPEFPCSIEEHLALGSEITGVLDITFAIVRTLHENTLNFFANFPFMRIYIMSLAFVSTYNKRVDFSVSLGCYKVEVR